MHKTKLLTMLCTVVLLAARSSVWARQSPIPGAEQTSAYLPALLNKRVGLVVNHTAQVGSGHLIDALQSRNVLIKKVFVPEHGFWGDVEAGRPVEDVTDPTAGLRWISLYGKRKYLSPAMLSDVDVLVFDMQDVGVRCYTYLTTLHYAMQACAQSGTPLIVLDRPNPNVHVVDGPILKPQFRSFVGRHPIPLAHGMTLGELALMINGEGWLDEGATCLLKVVPVRHYTRTTLFAPSTAPSPNLTTAHAVHLYPSLCLFEGTCMSVGRGTPGAFERLGYPDPHFGEFCFTPSKMHLGAVPKHAGRQCFGIDLRQARCESYLQLEWLLKCYAVAVEQHIRFFENGFDIHSGDDALRIQIESGWSAEKIRSSWRPALEAFCKRRKPYLLYP